MSLSCQQYVCHAFSSFLTTADHFQESSTEFFWNKYITKGNERHFDNAIVVSVNDSGAPPVIGSTSGFHASQNISIPSQNPNTLISPTTLQFELALVDETPPACQTLVSLDVCFFSSKDVGEANARKILSSS